MKELNDGGGAFPSVWGHAENIQSDPGMTLRDWFAGQALIAILSTVNDKTARVYAVRAYGMADAMIAAKEEERE